MKLKALIVLLGISQTKKVDISLLEIENDKQQLKKLVKDSKLL